MNLTRLTHQQALLLRDELERSSMIRHCLNCEHCIKQQDEKTVTCDLAPSAGQPPVRVLVYGCHNWSEEIPF